MIKTILSLSTSLILISTLIADDIKIGVILPLSGNLVAYGKSTLDGIKLRMDQVNTKGGIDGKKIKLIIEDNKGDTTDSRNALKKLVGSNKVVAVLGPITSTNSLAIRRDAKSLQIPIISPTATNDKVTLRNPYIFRTCFNDSFQGKIVANYAFNSKKNKTAAIMIDMNSDYSKGLAKSFKKAFTAAGGKIVTEEGYQQKDTEFGAQLKNIQKTNAETIFVPGYPPELPLIIKQAKVLGIKSRLCGADGWDNQAVINGSGDNINGCFIVGAFSREDHRPAVKNFIADYEKTFKKKPGTFEALGYDSANLVVKAIKTNGASANGVKEGLTKIKNLEAVTGKITIDVNGDAEKSAVILEIIKDGNKYSTKYKETVSP